MFHQKCPFLYSILINKFQYMVICFTSLETIVMKCKLLLGIVLRCLSKVFSIPLIFLYVQKNFFLSNLFKLINESMNIITTTFITIFPLLKIELGLLPKISTKKDIIYSTIYYMIKVEILIVTVCSDLTCISYVISGIYNLYLLDK